MQESEYRPSAVTRPDAGEGRQGVVPLPPAESAEPQQAQPPTKSAAKPSRLPEKTTAFVEQAFAAGADEYLKERTKLFLAHTVTKPHLTLRELAPFAGVQTKERARQLWNKGIQALWRASPPELQDHYPITDLLRRRAIALSPETRARIGAALRGKQLSPETRARIRQALKGKRRKPHSPESRMRISEAQRKRWERRKQQQVKRVIFDVNSRPS